MDPATFAKVHEAVKATPAEDIGWTEPVKEVIVKMVDTLKPGGDPKAIGSQVLNSCLKTTNSKEV